MKSKLPNDLNRLQSPFTTRDYQFTYNIAYPTACNHIHELLRFKVIQALGRDSAGNRQFTKLSAKGHPEIHKLEFKNPDGKFMTLEQTFAYTQRYLEGTAKELDKVIIQIKKDVSKGKTVNPDMMKAVANWFKEMNSYWEYLIGSEIFARTPPIYSQLFNDSPKQFNELEIEPNSNSKPSSKRQNLHNEYFDPTIHNIQNKYHNPENPPLVKTYYPDYTTRETYDAWQTLVKTRDDFNELPTWAELYG